MRRRSQSLPASASHRLERRALVLASLLVLVSGGASLGAELEPGATDGLRAAAREAKKSGDEKQRVLYPEPRKAHVARTETECEPCDNTAYIESLDRPAAHTHWSPEDWDAGVVAGGTLSGGSMLAPGVDFGLLLGYQPITGTRADLALMLGSRQFTAGSGLAGALDTPHEWIADLSLRHVLTHKGRPLAIASLLGVQIRGLDWNYHHAVRVDDGSGAKLVHADFLDSYGAYVGVAKTLFDTPSVRLDAVAKAGARFYDSRTWVGLRNDAFRTTGFLQVQFETRLPF